MKYQLLIAKFMHCSSDWLKFTNQIIAVYEYE